MASFRNKLWKKKFFAAGFIFITLDNLALVEWTYMILGNSKAARIKNRFKGEIRQEGDAPNIALSLLHPPPKVFWHGSMPLAAPFASRDAAEILVALFIKRFFWPSIKTFLTVF